MPVFRSGKALAPAWCELEFFQIIDLPAGSRHAFDRTGAREKLIVGRGACRVRLAGQVVDAQVGANLDLSEPGEAFDVVETRAPTTLVRMCGRWGATTRGSGVFRASPSQRPQDAGDPVDYPKHTDFDNHYHDCDEYWIVFQGRGLAVSEGKTYTLGPGDCLATGMGHHHDLPEVLEPIEAAYFETTLEGKMRFGHLWEHTHGPAKPKPDRV